MPRFKPKGMLERNALADLWKHTLYGISSVFGRLTYLASLRDPNSGHYRHYGLSTAFGREECASALRQSHEQVFREWLKLPLPEKSSDLREYLAGVDDKPAVVASNWLRTCYYEILPPDRATRPHRAQFRQELEMLLQILRNGAAAGPVSPGSSRSA